MRHHRATPTAGTDGMSRAHHDAVRSLPPIACCLGVLTTTQPAWCVQSTRLPPGARVRLEAPSLGGQLMGTLVRLENDTLTMEEDGQAEGLRLIILTDSIARLEVRHERSLALEGAGAGLLTGTLVALTADPNWLDENGNCTTMECIAYKVSPQLGTRLAVLGVVGTLLGVIAGSGEKKHSWEQVPLRRLEVGPAPGGGMALGLRISF